MLRMILVVAALANSKQYPISPSTKFDIPVEDRAAYIAGFRAASFYGLYFFNANLKELGATAPDDTNFASISDFASYSSCGEYLPPKNSFGMRWKYLSDVNKINLSLRCDDFVYSGQQRNTCDVEKPFDCNYPMKYVRAYPVNFPGGGFGQSSYWTLDNMTPTSMRISMPSGYVDFSKPDNLVLPELLVDSLLAYWEPGRDSILFSYRVVNWSSKTAPAYDIEIVYNGAALGKKNGDSLSGQFFTKYALFLPWQKDLTTIQIRIDPDKAIREVTKTNNFATESWDTSIPVSVRPFLTAGSTQVGRTGYRDLLGRRVPLSAPVKKLPSPLPHQPK